MHSLLKWSAAAALCASATFTSSAYADYSISGANVNGASIVFASTTIIFQDGIDDFDFVITDSDGGAIDGAMGNFGASSFIGLIAPIMGGELAPVVATNFFTFDFGGGTFTADLEWTSILSSGTTVALNAFGAANLTNMSYTGSSAYLQGLAALDEATIALTAQFIPGKSLTQLTAVSALNMSSYSFAIYAVPEPSTYALIGVGLVGAGLSLRRSKQASKRLG
jgi:hypothetical protein